MEEVRRIAVLASDEGTRLQMLIDGIEAEKMDITIEIVISDRKCLALEVAKKAGIDTREFSDVKDLDELNKRLDVVLDFNDLDLIVIAGYHSVIGPNILDKYNVIATRSYPITDASDKNIVESTLRLLEPNIGGPTTIISTFVVSSDDTEEDVSKHAEDGEIKSLISMLKKYKV